MELLALKEKVLELFGTDIEGLGASLKTACMSQDERTFDRFCELVEGDLSEDWMQKIYQYYLVHHSTINWTFLTVMCPQ